MRLFITILLLASAVCVKAQLLYTTNLFTYQAVTGAPAAPVTNNGTVVWLQPLSLPRVPLIVQNTAFAPTNTSLTVNEQLTFDGVNYYTVATYQPAVTNAGVNTFNVPLQPPIGVRVQIISTNGMSVGVDGTPPYVPSSLF